MESINAKHTNEDEGMETTNQKEEPKKNGR